MPTPSLFRAIPLTVAVVLVAAVLACSSGDDSPPTPVPASPNPEVVASPTPGPRQGPTADGPTGPGPRAGLPCPVERDLCDFATRLFALVSAGNVDALVAQSEPIAAKCPSGGLGGPSAALCAGAAPGETRRGYWDVQAGEGMVVTEAEWRRTLGRWLTSITAAQGSDVYGPGGLKIGSLSCARAPERPAGTCGPDNVRVHLTFINSPALGREAGTGPPGQRTSFSLIMHRNATGELRLEGSATTVPPNTVLLAWSVDAVDVAGKPVVIQYYPWTP